MSFLARRATAAAPGLARAFSASARRDVAKITLVGNLAAPPEVRATSTGRELIEYAVASNYGPKDNRQTSWFRVAAFIEEGPRRDFLTSLPKGATVYVEGDATMNAFTDAEGKSRRNIEVLKRPTPPE
ncbi:nucleic acid-binding protein [Daldinia decipiens]|uniref:nucleic acid-binding protein n=1 Tax=Daldinia decipiens TaxID=326647 RepID=UPI0020C46078|nr:nucleic acid-binding protein [Daldinia decipiens]KAI1653192.1 nucleic acid-binding protein [Daldinia decipiens]